MYCAPVQKERLHYEYSNLSIISVLSVVGKLYEDKVLIKGARVGTTRDRCNVVCMDQVFAVRQVCENI